MENHEETIKSSGVVHGLFTSDSSLEHNLVSEIVFDLLNSCWLKVQFLFMVAYHDLLGITIH